MRLELHAGDGGQDAHAFAVELGTLIARHAGTTLDANARVVTVEVPDRL